ncbi:MAG: T9SS type A sorting domain-containing protein [Saprospiraceae bacterium]
MKKVLLFTILIFQLNFGFSIEYNVGPGQTYTEVGEAPWISLQAGDIINIHWRSTPYPTKVFMRAQGTADNPVIIRGIPNSAGELPILTGENAVTDPQFTSDHFDPVWTETLSMFLIFRAQTDNYNTYKPKHITFEYLELTGVKPEHTFTDQFGQIRNYNIFGTAINAIVCENLTVRKCKIHHNSQGIFTNTNGNEGQISRNLLIEYNEIGENGNVGDDRHHNIYAQSAGTIIQYNKITPLIPGALGSSLKDRSSGTIVRYNWIEASSRVLDLVETEDGYDILSNEPDNDNVFIYGNIIINDITTLPLSSSMIHFGHDNSPGSAKRGTMHFFNNTVYIKGDQTDYWYVNLFDIVDDDNVSTTEASIDMYNNIVHKDGTTNLRLMRDGGAVTLYENNWLQDDYAELGYEASAIVTYDTDPILGTDPGFENVAILDFALSETSSCIDIAGPIPSSLDLYPLDEEYILHANSAPRVAIGGALDLGAIEAQSSTLSVDLFYFGVELSQNKETIVLDWKTLSEIDNKGFEIQAINKNEKWEKIGWIDGKSEVQINKYRFIDDNPRKGINYYRLKQIDNSGLTEFSEVKSIVFNDHQEYVIFPNPAYSSIEIIPYSNDSYKIYDSHGRLLLTGTRNNSKIDVSQIKQGIYIITIFDGKTITNKRFVKQ